MSDNFKLNRRGGSAVLKEMFGDQINQIAEQVAKAAKVAADRPDEVDVTEYTTDRQGASVRVAASDQAINGALTKAASAAGLEVRSK